MFPAEKYVQNPCLSSYSFKGGNLSRKTILIIRFATPDRGARLLLLTKLTICFHMERVLLLILTESFGRSISLHGWFLRRILLLIEEHRLVFSFEEIPRNNFIEVNVFTREKLLLCDRK